jgi:gliding motility-associated-like protein
VTLQFSQLIVTDPDNDYPHGFILKVLPGDNYRVEGTTVVPLFNFTGTTLLVTVVVNDGRNDSPPFEVKIEVAPITSVPKINGQKELHTLEDNPIAISLSDLIVTDADDPDYPTGFTLSILPSDNGRYTVDGNTIIPAANVTGFVEVSVNVNDGLNTSDDFSISILVIPVNDPPEIFDSGTATPWTYEPGTEPISVLQSIDIRDADSNHLSMAEIGFQPVNFKPENDELVVSVVSKKIRAIHDPKGIVFLIGYATLEEYRDAIREIQYTYRLTHDEHGNPTEILSGARSLFVKVYDGQLESLPYEREIKIEVNVTLDVPTAFTPNGDNANDTWHLHVTNTDQVDDAIIRVYDKRGVLLYESKGFEKEWDGFANGQALPPDSYYYTIDLNLPYIKKTFKGVVTILR